MIDMWFGPTAPQWTPDAVLRNIVLAAEHVDTRIQTHVLESYYESLESPRSRSNRILPHLAELGFLNHRTSMAHMVWGDPRDFDLLAKSGVQISCNPSSNLRLRSGIAPAARYHDAGIILAVGMDGTTLADDEDMFAELRLVLNLNRPPHPSGSSLSARDVFGMATTGGAKLLGKGNELGQLQRGFRADLTLVDTGRITMPWVDPDTDPLILLLTRTRKDDVRDVFVNGRHVLKSGSIQCVNEDQLLIELIDALSSLPPKNEERALCKDLRPFLLEWYKTWDVAADADEPSVRSYSRELRKYDTVL